MQIQTVFKAGNSSVVAIPKEFVEEYGYQPGLRVKVVPVGEGNSLLVEKISKPKVKKTSEKVSQEFNKWLEGALKEDAQILDELA